jgi:hypothetical protein
MASKESDARLRIPIGLAVAALAVAALFLTWSPEIELWFRISGSLMCTFLLLWAAVILVEKPKTGRQILTRRRWKYLTTLGAVVAGIVTLTVFIIVAAQPDRYSPLVSPLFPMLLAMVAAYMYEPGGPPLIRGPATDRDAKVWKRTALVSGIIGISLGGIAIIAAAAGNIDTLALLSPVAVVLLITAAVQGAKLRARNRHRTNP